MATTDWRRVGLLAAAVLALHIVGFGILVALVAPHAYALGGGSAFGVGIGITAYALGLRHAFDADHIAAIDNTTRKLMSEGQRPLGVGFFFSLGHSTVVAVLGLLVGLGVRGLGAAVADPGSGFHRTTGLVGPLLSGTLLLAIAALNLVVLVNLFAIFRRMREGSCDEAELERQLGARGIMGRFYGRATRAVRASWQMYPLGCLFGLGFDTASEIALLVLAGGAAASGLPLYAIACLPILFAAGMSLLDTLDGMFMNFAYGWAVARPVRKVFYNLTMTALSVGVALAIGTIEIASVIVDRLDLHGGAWTFVAGLDLSIVGYAIVGLFVLTWALAVAVWRFGRIEERWSARVGA